MTLDIVNIRARAAMVAQTIAPDPLRATDSAQAARWLAEIDVPNLITEIEANARLLADLLAALQLAECVYRRNVTQPGEPSSVLDAMQAAIRKATGGRP